MKLPIVLCLLVVLAPAWGQAPQWRAVRLTMPAGHSGIVQLNDRNEFLLARSGSDVRTLRTASGQLLTPPFGFYDGELTRDGNVFGSWGGQIGTWTPSSGVFVYPDTDGLLPNLYHPTGGAVGMLYGPGSAGYDVRYWLNPNGNRTFIVGTDGPAHLTHMNAHGTISGQIGDRSQAGFLPGIWTNQGQTFSPRTVPGMQFGSVLFTDDNGVSFGKISRTGSQAGWYGVWWNPDGTVLREEYLQPLSPNPMSSASTSDGRFLISISTPGFSAERNVVRYWSATTGFINLEDHVTGIPSGYRIYDAPQITQDGRILARLIRPNGTGYLGTYYLEPVPEPATLAGLALGLGWMARRRNRQAA